VGAGPGQLRPAADPDRVAAVAPLALVAGAGSLVVRFRHARGVERQQLRWLAFAAALTGWRRRSSWSGMAMGATAVPLFAAGVCLAVLPLATGAAILRYRLYDLDRIVSRTLAYGLLTVLLASAYAGVVLGLGRLLRQGSSLVVAAATLAVAGAFQPARRRVQQAVDRRFDRRRYDAAQTIAAFSDRLRPAGRPGRPGRRAAGGGGPDDAANQRVAVASTVSRDLPGATDREPGGRGIRLRGRQAVGGWPPRRPVAG
jgi:hypothetical protein